MARNIYHALKTIESPYLCQLFLVNFAHSAAALWEGKKEFYERRFSPFICMGYFLIEIS